MMSYNISHMISFKDRLCFCLLYLTFLTFCSVYFTFTPLIYKLMAFSLHVSAMHAIYCYFQGKSGYLKCHNQCQYHKCLYMTGQKRVSASQGYSLVVSKSLLIA